MEIRLLGPVEVVLDDHPVPLAAKQRAVLAVLAWQVNVVVARSEIVRLAWGDREGAVPRTVDRLVADYISHLRTRLHRAGGRDAARLVSRSSGYVLDVDADAVDWHRFEQLRRSGRAARDAGEAGDAARLLYQALWLWRGPALADLPDACLDPIRTELDSRRLAAAEDLAELERGRGNPDHVVDLLAGLAAQHPERERIAAQLVGALGAAGRRDEAIGVYQRTRRYLAERLGLDPTPPLEQAYRQVIDDTRPPPAVIEPSRLAQLPPDTPNFTGRAVELVELLSPPGHPDRRVPPRPLIYAIEGMAGTGKTALAVHAAHHLAARFPDGCLFLDLHGWTTGVPPVRAAQALDVLLRALGAPAEQIPSELSARASAYRGLLADRQMLILLDNATTAEQVRPLLPAARGCLVLVTSRNRLTALEGAQPLALSALPAPDAIALFDRIVTPVGLSADQHTVGIVVRLCGRLPLAVRIAAARMRSRPDWTPRQLVDLLTDQHHLLGRLDDGDRGTTAVLTLSYQQLTADQQRAFRLLGLHPGPDIDPYAAAALTGATLAHTVGILDHLLDVDLLTQTTHGRYVLHDLVRTFAAERAAPPAPAGVRRETLASLFSYYLAATTTAMDSLYPADDARRPRIPLADSPVPPLADPDAARAWLDTERANLTAICAHPTDRHDQALVLFRSIGHRPGEAGAVVDLGLVRARQGRYQQAIDHHQQALALFRTMGDSATEAEALNGVGQALLATGRADQARAHHAAALRLASQLGDPYEQARAHDGLAHTHQATGQSEQARHHWQRALALYTRLDVPEKTAVRALLSDLEI